MTDRTDRGAWQDRAVVLTLTLLLMACEHRGGDPVTIAELRAEREPVEELADAKIQTSENGLPRIHIEADVMQKFETEDSTYMVMQGDTSSDRVLVRLFDEQGQPSAVIKANRVIQNEGERRFEARGDVEVVTVTGKRLESEELRWQEDERIIRSSGFVRIETPTEQLSGYELEASEDLESYRLERVTGQVTLTE